MKDPASKSPRPANSRATSLDVAEAVGVSQSTVSRSLSDDPRISDATRARVEKAAKRLGYRPNIAARSLITSRTRTMGLAVSDINNPFYPSLIEALYAEFRDLGYGTLLFNSEEETEGDPLAPFLAHSIDGLLVCSATLDSRLGVAAQDEGLPTVFLVRHTSEPGNRVISDNRGGAGIVANLFTDLGHERIAVISGPSNTSTSLERDAGFLAALEERGVTVPPHWKLRGQYSHDVGFRLATSLLTGDDVPTAIFCGNDVIAFGALNAVEKLGLDCPGDVSIAGFGDIPIAGWPRIGLTPVRQNLPGMARAAARMLVEHVEESAAPPATEVFDTELVYRGTVGPPKKP